MKRSVFFLGVFFLMAFCQTGSCNVAYTGASLRDPFSDANSNAAPAKTVPQEQQQPAPASMNLQGIVISPNGQAHAIIDGVIVTVGSKLKLGQVKSIDRGGVTVSYNGGNYYLPDKGRTANENTQNKKTLSK